MSVFPGRTVPSDVDARREALFGDLASTSQNVMDVEVPGLFPVLRTATWAVSVSPLVMAERLSVNVLTTSSAVFATATPWKRLKIKVRITTGDAGTRATRLISIWPPEPHDGGECVMGECDSDARLAAQMFHLVRLSQKEDRCPRGAAP